MKHSIKNIFNNLIMLWILISFVTALSILSTIERNSSFKKVNSLITQKATLTTLIQLNKKDIEYALIQYNGKTTHILNKIEILRNLYIYDFTGRYILDNSNEYMSDLDKLSELVSIFNDKATHYYTNNIKDEKINFQELHNYYSKINNHINSIIFKNISYEELKFHMIEKISIVAFLLILFTTIWYRKRLNIIYNDILFLFSANANKANYEIFSEEVNAISHRMKRKHSISEDTSMMDQATDIYNAKGFFKSFTEKKNLKGENLTFITILEVDNFSQDDNQFTKETTNAILRKIAFSISLYEQTTDVVARTQYNQFSIILSRQTKEKAFKEIEAIRQSISEIKFKNNDAQSINITVSGGFVIKTENTSLEEATKEAKRVLQRAKDSGKNKISQVNDFVK